MFILDSPETDCRIVNWPMCAVFGVITKDDNMLIV